MAREMLKLRKGDSAIMVKSDGSVELAGVNDKPIMNDKGMVSPIILFAAAWAKKDESLLNHMVDNFKNCVREGYFGPEAQADYKAMEVAAEKEKIRQQEGSASGAVTLKTTEIIPNISPEEAAKHKAEEDAIKHIAAQGQDPAVLKQMEAMKSGATTTTTAEYTGHKLPETNTADQEVGTVTIEENTDNENQ